MLPAPTSLSRSYSGVSLTSARSTESDTTVSTIKGNRGTKMTSYEIFMKFVQYDEYTGKADAKGIFSKRCFNAWLATRAQAPKRAGESFRRALVSQLTASDGRKPFPPPVEESVLVNLRAKRVWACFKGTNTTIGIQGFTKHGFHEKQRRKSTIPVMKKEVSLELSNGVQNHSRLKQFAHSTPALNFLEFTDFENEYISNQINIQRQHILSRPENQPFPNRLNIQRDNYNIRRTNSHNQHMFFESLEIDEIPSLHAEDTSLDDFSDVVHKILKDDPLLSDSGPFYNNFAY